jgi:filamentous hemagglutinin family protein
MPPSPDRTAGPLRARRGRVLRAGALAVAIAALVPRASAQIATDGSLGAVRSLTGPNFAIDAALGRQVGSNLFQSFSVFNLSRGESATFSGPGTVQNVLARVTGGAASGIDGLLRSDIPGANLYFLNPAGVVFGPNASIDVQGSFHVSSASYLRLGDGARFAAATGGADLLSAAPPAAFGFADARPGSIALHGTRLVGKPGTTLSVIGGEIALDQASPSSPLGTQLVVPGGTVQLLGAASAGEVVPALADLGTSALARLAPVTLSPGTAIVVNGPDAGAIGVRGASVALDGAVLWARTSANGRSGSITVAARDALTIGGTGTADDGARFASNLNATTRGGEGGTIALSADRVTLSDRASIQTVSEGAGRPGALRIDARDITLRGGALVESTSVAATAAAPLTLQASGTLSLSEAAQVRASTTGSGRGADVLVTAARLSMTDRDTGLGTASGGAGRAGDVNVNATSEATIAGGAALGSVPLRSGDAGAIAIRTPRLVLTSATIGGETQAGSTGRAADIAIAVGDLALAGGTISASTVTAASAGTVSIDASGTVGGSGATLAAASRTGGGAAGTVAVRAATLALGGNSVISVSTLGDGAAGRARIDAGRVELSGSSWINARSGDDSAGGAIVAGAGNAGAVELVATQSVRFADPGSGITTASYGSGAAGPVSLASPVLDLNGGALIQSSTAGGQRTGPIDLALGTLAMSGGAKILADNALLLQGAAGAVAGSGALAPVSVRASGAVTLGGSGTMIASRNFGSGAAGDLSLSAASLDVVDGALVSTRTFSAGRGSTIRVDVDQLRTTALTPGADAISSSSFGAGRAGDLVVVARQSADVRGAISSSASRAGAAGNLSLNTSALTVSAQAGVQSRALGDGDAGTVRIVADRVQLLGGGQVSSASGQFDAGTGGFVSGRGAAGAVTLDARTSLDIAGRASPTAPSAVSSQTVGAGHAGTVTITSPIVVIRDFGQVSAGTAGSGAAGSAVLRVGDLLVLDGGSLNSASGLPFNGVFRQGGGAGGDLQVAATGTVLVSGAATGIAATTTGPGHGGNVSIAANLVTLREGGRVIASSTGTGDAGDIRIVAGDAVLLSGASTISTSAARADGGNIAITAPHAVYLKGSAIQAAVRQGGNGGNITIDPDLVILTDASRISADAQFGNGGNILVTITNAGALIQSLDSTITASSAFGVSGTVEIKGPDSDILGRITRLPAVIVDAQALLAERCAARAASSRQSSFVVAGRGGLPAGPADSLTTSVLDLDSEAGRVGAAGGGATAPPVQVASVECRSQ